MQLHQKVKELIEACGARVYDFSTILEVSPLIDIHPGERGFYLIVKDVIAIGDNSDDPELINLVTLHELIHWTGAKNRLDRCVIDKLHRCETGQELCYPGIVERTTKELIAHYGMYLLCKELNILREEAAKEVDRLETKYFPLFNQIKAEKEAMKAADYLLNFLIMKQAA